MATSRDSAAFSTQTSYYPLLGMQTPVAQNYFLERAAALIAGRCSFQALQAGFSASELDFLRRRYASAFNKAVAHSDPRLLLAIVKGHWTSSNRSFAGVWFRAVSRDRVNVALGVRQLQTTIPDQLQRDSPDSADDVDEQTRKASSEARTALLALHAQSDQAAKSNAPLALLALIELHWLESCPPRSSRSRTYDNFRAAVNFRESLNFSPRLRPATPGPGSSHQCHVHPALTHSNAACHAQHGYPERKPTAGSACAARATRPASVSTLCHLCALPGHKLFDCPYKSAATEAAAADVKLGVAPSRRRGGTALAAVSPEVLPSGVVSLRKSAKAAVRAWHTAALLALISDDASTDPDDDDGRPLIGLDTMSDNHLIFDRSLFVQSSIKRLNPPILIEGATGALEFTEQGDLYVNSILITGALFCPTSPYHLLSVGRLVRDYPSWDWALPSRPVPVLQAWSSAGRLLISAVQRDELFLFRCSLGPQPCAAPVRQLHSRARSFPLRRPPPSLARLRSPLAGLALPAVALAAPVPAVVAPVPPAVPNIPLSIDSLSLSYSEFMWWHRQLGHPSLGRMRWYLHAYPQLDFGKMPSSLFCVACSEGKSHRASMRAARAGLDPLKASVGDGFSVDIKTSTTPGCDDLAYTAIVVSRRTKYAWALHAATKDLLRAKLRAWYLAYTLRYSAVNGPLLMFRADNDTALFPPADTAFWDSYGVVLSFSAPYTPWLNGLAESFIRTVYVCAYPAA